ncbi:MAG: hypothetical protein KF754_02815 [Planctomycetes bacterium]|nr:hypothetical protein [Planctomycetota bacterium]
MAKLYDIYAELRAKGMPELAAFEFYAGGSVLSVCGANKPVPDELARDMLSMHAIRWLGQPVKLESGKGWKLQVAGREFAGNDPLACVLAAARANPRL